MLTFRLFVRVLFLLFISFLFVISTATAQDYDCAAQSEVPEIECEALVALYNSTDGDNWENNMGWLTDEPYWAGVDIDDGHVRGIQLSSNGLTGSLPPELGNLSKLEYLYLFNNALTV